jgi:hypothetical protein
LDEHAGTLGFWTVTLPEHEAENLTREQVATFQSRLLFFARRMMQRKGVRPLVVLVAELHPKRRTMGGRIVPHWHAVVKVSEQPFGPWAVSVQNWHWVISQAHNAAFGRHRRHWHGCKMKPCTVGAVRYLAPYLSKGGTDPATMVGTRNEGSIPRQWWSWTGELRALVTGCRWRPPSGFLRHCCRWWENLEAAGLATVGDIRISDDGARVGRWFSFTDEDALDWALEVWAAEEEETLRARGEPAGAVSWLCP